MPEPTQPILRASNLTIAVPSRTLVSALDLDLARGEFVAVLGENGAGKSLTLHTLAGLRKQESGHVELDGTELDRLSRKAVARTLALLPQDCDDVFPATVFETALIGRHPHIETLRWESAEDRAIALRCLDCVDLSGLADRDIATLSGGERKRLAVAQTLAQEPSVFLLDEPTNHLDPQHQLDTLSLFVQRARDGAAVLASLHDVNLAARFADRCLLLYGDGRWALGPTGEILSAATLSELYDVDMESVSWRGGQLFVAAGRPEPKHFARPA